MEIQNASLDIEKAYLIYRDDVIRSLIGFGVKTCEAEDITQDAFLRLIAPAPGVQAPKNFFRWLLACTRNLAINRYHRKRWELPSPREAWQRWESILPGNEEPIDVRLHRKRLMLEVHRALENMLSPIEKGCLVLRSRGATYREIALKLGISMDRAIYATGRAIDKLHDQLGKFV